jgi:hypothetical protein
MCEPGLTGTTIVAEGVSDVAGVGRVTYDDFCDIAVGSSNKWREGDGGEMEQ